MARRTNRSVPQGINDMNEATQAMNAMAATMAQQAMVQAQRDAQRDHRDEAACAARALNEFRRQDLPKFKGEHDPDKADLWLQEIKKIFEILHCLDNAKVEYATYLMIGEAEYWWRGAKKMMETNHEELTWEAFKNKFLEKYFPKSARVEKEAQFLKLYQGNLTIAEYAGHNDQQNRGRQHQQHKPYPRPLGNARDQPDLKTGKVKGQKLQKPDHFANECPERKDDRAVNRNNINKNVVSPTVKGRVYHRNGEEAPSSSELIQGGCLIARKSLNHVRVILGMDWLSSHYVLLDCARKSIIFQHPGVSRFLDTNKLNFSLKGGVQKCVSLNSANMKLKVEVDGILVVKDFPEVFPLDVLGLPTIRDIDFSIDVTPGKRPISISPYRMSPSELSEMQNQLEDLLSK
ncbi:uncharacterized protein [Cicer arietinum]|uniref:Uncharacterized protein LOC105852119 n=1 Tax=Cicer arietinum TaxID=3827 RepID=A0A1S3E5V6_CICAR|nr:uncharacterized protein LOC105852119 [Cicer arietinum]